MTKKRFTKFFEKGCSVDSPWPNKKQDPFRLRKPDCSFGIIPPTQAAARRRSTSHHLHFYGGEIDIEVISRTKSFKFIFGRGISFLLLN